MMLCHRLSTLFVTAVHSQQTGRHLQVNLKQEQIIVEEKKAKTGALIETIGHEKAVVDEAVEAGREDEEAAAKLQVRRLPPFCASAASCLALKTCLGLYSFKQREQLLVPLLIWPAASSLNLLLPRQSLSALSSANHWCTTYPIVCQHLFCQASAADLQSISHMSA